MSVQPIDLQVLFARLSLIGREQMAHRKASELLAKEVECPLTREQVRDIDAIVEEATAKMGDDGR